MANEHVTTIRIPIELADQLELVARAEETTVSYVIREAIAAYIEKKRADPLFQRRLRERIESDRAILERLAEGPDDASPNFRPTAISSPPTDARPSGEGS